MGINTVVYLAVVWLWCSLHAGRHPVIVSAQPNGWMLDVEILTLEAERKEGGQICMKCTATNFVFQHVALKWQKDNITLIQGEVTDPRFKFSLGNVDMNTIIFAVLCITGVLRADSGLYTCNAVDNREDSGDNIVASVHISLSVLYFPLPICSPAGSITAVAGTELNLQCSSEIGNPQVTMEVSQTKYNDTFTLSHHGDMISMSLDLIADTDYNGILFQCTITSPMYYHSNSQSCFIGPINVSNVDDEPPTTVTTEPSTTPLTESTHLPSPMYPSHNETTSVPIIAGAVAGVVVLIGIIILTIVCLSRRGLCKMKQSSDDNTIQTTTSSPRDNNSDPFQQNFNNYDGHDNQNRAEDEVASPPPEPMLSYSGTTLPRRVEVPDSSLVYAKPQKATTRLDNAPSVTNVTEQSYTNPVFDSKGTKDTDRPCGDHSKTAIKPVAIIQPNTNVPRKPTPYQPKSDRTRYIHDNPITPASQTPTQPSQPNDSGHAAMQQDNHNGSKATQEMKSNVPKKPAPYKPKSDRTRSIHGNPITSPSPAPTSEFSSGHPWDGRQETSLFPSDITYAQVSVPMRQSSSSSQRPVDDNDITYADLDMTSYTIQDGGVNPSAAEATIMQL